VGAARDPGYGRSPLSPGRGAARARVPTAGRACSPGTRRRAARRSAPPAAGCPGVAGAAPPEQSRAAGVREPTGWPAAGWSGLRQARARRSRPWWWAVGRRADGRAGRRCGRCGRAAVRGEPHRRAGRLRRGAADRTDPRVRAAPTARPSTVLRHRRAPATTWVPAVSVRDSSPRASARPSGPRASARHVSGWWACGRRVVRAPGRTGPRGTPAPAGPRRDGVRPHPPRPRGCSLYSTPAPIPMAQPLPGRPAIARCTASSARLAVDLTVPRLIPVASAISASDIPP
jgi:hypothetical protein